MAKGTIYLIHFDEPIGNRENRRGQAQHYIGYAVDLAERLAEHANGDGARIMAAVIMDYGIGWQVVRTWKGGRKDERKLKNRKQARRFCPVCSKKIC
jgi:predicted GIY-YIG superfamily endonuclease